MSVTIDNELTSMSTLRELEGDMNDNIHSEIIKLDGQSVDIEDTFLDSGNENNSNTNNGDKSNRSRKSTFNQPTRSSRNKEFRFVNNSPTSMVKPKLRMKPTFKVENQPHSNDQTTSKSKTTFVIEQQIDSSETNFVNSSDKKYIFQLNVKRPPGRPRKYPIEETKIKRPQGRPRKYPIEVTGTSSTLGNSKVLKKSIKETPTYVIDNELTSVSRRGRGRPKRGDKEDDVQKIVSKGDENISPDLATQ